MRVIGTVKMLSAAVIAVALAASLYPASAMADVGALRAGDASGAVSAQAVKPKSAKVAPKSLVALYKPVLKRAVKGTGVFAKRHGESDSAYWNPTYSVFDIGHDGVPELLVRTGTFTANIMEDVFTVKAGKVKHIGTYWDGAGGSAGNSKGQLYSAGWRTGGSTVYRITFKGGKATSKLVATGRATAADPAGEIRAANNYLKRRGAKWLKVSSATNYSLLKKKAKVSSKKIYDARVSVQKSATYTGKKIAPRVTVKYLGRTLKAGSDYKVVYKNAKGRKVAVPKAAGAYRVIVKGKGGFKGSQTATFTVKKRAAMTAKTTGVKLVLPEYWRGKVNVEKSRYETRRYITVRDKRGALVMQVQCAPKASFSVDGQMGTQVVGRKDSRKYTAAVTWDSFGAMARYDSTVRLQTGGKVKGMSAAFANKDSWIKRTNSYLKKAIYRKMVVY